MIEAECNVLREHKGDLKFHRSHEWYDPFRGKRFCPGMEEKAKEVVGIYYVPTPRNPEPNIVVFKLGHFEQMIIQKALEVLEETEYGNEPVTKAETARNLARIFEGHGSVTIIRENDEPMISLLDDPWEPR